MSSCMAEKDQLRPWLGDVAKWPPNGLPKRQNPTTFLASHGNSRKCSAPACTPAFPRTISRPFRCLRKDTTAVKKTYHIVNREEKTAAVLDELFLQDDFLDPRDLVQVKYEMLRSVRTEGKSVTDAAANFGFSRPSFYQAQSAFEQDGLAGLVPHKRGPKQAHKLTEEVLAFIGEVRQQEPSIRLPDLVNRIQKRFGTKVHPRSIERSLLRHQEKLR